MRACLLGKPAFVFMGVWITLIVTSLSRATAGEVEVVRTSQSGMWSDANTWESKTLPKMGQSVLIRPGHQVIYDIQTERPFRTIQIGGQLEFSREKSTRLDCGLIRIQPGDQIVEDGFDCEIHETASALRDLNAALAVGSPDHPIPAGFEAIIRLHAIEGLDQKSFPAIVCCAGRMQFHGTPLSRTWVKLGANAKAEDTEIQLAEPVNGWKPGDKILVVSTERLYLFGEGRKLIPTVRDASQSEERTIKSIFRDKLVLNQPLTFSHLGEGEFRGEVANLSRNLIVESADPNGVRGHTMYHRDSFGSIGFAEFRFLGKKDTLGRYSLHFHQCRDTAAM